MFGYDLFKTFLYLYYPYSYYFDSESSAVLFSIVPYNISYLIIVSVSSKPHILLLVIRTKLIISGDSGDHRHYEDLNNLFVNK